MNKNWTLLTLLLLLCVGPAMAAPAVPSQTPVLCVGDPVSSLLATNAQASTLDSLFAPAPVNQQGPPICQVYCVTTQCSSNAECTAAPNGRCNFACPGVGCCVYR